MVTITRLSFPEILRWNEVEVRIPWTAFGPLLPTRRYTPGTRPPFRRAEMREDRNFKMSRDYDLHGYTIFSSPIHGV
jgi:hypothetical protein